VEQADEIRQAADRLLDFTEFFLRLGDLQGPQVLSSIAEHDPEFTWHYDDIAGQIETIMDLFKFYGEWSVNHLRAEYTAEWPEVVNAALADHRWEILKMQWSHTTPLWDELVEIVGG
jgi:hypothetical protein